MPELPEVETIKTAMERSVGKANIIKLSINNKKLREIIPEDFPQKVQGAKIETYKRIAKYITIGLNNGLSIIWHLGMSGKIKISDTPPQQLAKHDHVVLETSNGTIVYNDARRFGVFTYCETATLKKHKLLAKCGIDPFEKELNADYLFEKLKNKTIPIKIALLDQSIICGIGNIYASEALFMSGILPTRQAKDITSKECEKLLDNIRVVLQKAIEAGGSTLKDYQKPDGSLGYFQNMHCVYNKTGQKCVGCTCDVAKTGGIQKIVQAGRSTFYCPVKQK